MSAGNAKEEWVARLRARAMGIEIGPFPPGALNAITDVAGVAVGHTSISWGDSALPPGHGPSRTGVTVVWPHRYDLIKRPVAAGFFALSGTGEMTGRSEIEELGRINTPISLTNTMSVGTVYDAVCRYFIQRSSAVGDGAGVLIPVVAECDDSFLHDARGFHVSHEHVWQALDKASDGWVAEGCVGAGVGMHCFQFKGGIGTASRRLPHEIGGWTVGALVLTNFGRRPRLTIDGVPVGKHLPIRGDDQRQGDDGSGIVIIATDAPLDGRQLARVAKRASLGLGRTGSIGGNGSGELVIAFSTTYMVEAGDHLVTRRVVDGDGIDPIFAATIDVTEEAVLNALFRATTMDGRHERIREAIPLDRVRDLLVRHGRVSGEQNGN